MLYEQNPYMGRRNNVLNQKSSTTNDLKNLLHSAQGPNMKTDFKTADNVQSINTISKLENYDKLHGLNSTNFRDGDKKINDSITFESTGKGKTGYVNSEIYLEDKVIRQNAINSLHKNMNGLNQGYNSGNAISRIVEDDEILTFDQLSENNIKCSKSGEIHYLFLQQCFVCVCIRDYFKIKPKCVKCNQCMEPKPNPIITPAPVKPGKLVSINCSPVSKE